jgi:chemotaxis protein methyltransferase CheR
VRQKLEFSDPVKPLAPHEFEQIRQLAHKTFGLDLKHGKEELVSARLRKLVRSGGFRGFQDYYRSIVEDKTGDSLIAMIDALTTNHTSFFREPDHFDYLRQQVLPALANRDLIEIWCAACATGEEVWTLAMVLQEAGVSRKVRIHASDISSRALAFAQAAAYPKERCQGVAPDRLSRHFQSGGSSLDLTINPALRTLASFRRINLIQSYSWPRPFPVIFCRNVMIYFDRETQQRVVKQLTQWLEPGGYLFVGHAESLTRIEHDLDYVKPALYRKPANNDGRWNRSS